MLSRMRIRPYSCGRLHVLRPAKPILHNCVARASMATSCFAGNTVEELQRWLGAYGVDTSKYGLGTAKTVAELLEEHQRAESMLRDDGAGGALRVVRVLSLLVTNAQGKVLYEREQVLPDGRVRRRNLPLCEKMVGDESWQHAVGRAVREELGSVLPPQVPPHIEVDAGSHSESSEVSASMSYPGLPTQYVFHRVAASVGGLPPGPFTTHEERPGGQMVTHWEWREHVPGQAPVKGGGSGVPGGSNGCAPP